MGVARVESVVLGALLLSSSPCFVSCDTPSPLNKKMSLFLWVVNFLRSRALPSPVPQFSSDTFLISVGVADSVA